MLRKTYSVLVKGIQEQQTEIQQEQQRIATQQQEIERIDHCDQND